MTGSRYTSNNYVDSTTLAINHGLLEDKPSGGAPQSAPNLGAYYNSYADEFIRFMNQTPTTYQTITHFKSLLVNNGFTEIPDNQYNTATEPGFYFVTKDDLTIVAYIIGGQWTPQNGSCFACTHSDALSIKLNHNSKRESVEGYELLAVAPYSGSLNVLWLNRDLGLAGSVLIKDGDGQVHRKLISSGSYPIAHIPKLAEHFGLDELLDYNTQTEMVPVLAHGGEALEPTQEELDSPWYQKHSLALLRYICQLANVSISDIVDLDLDLFDVQPAARGGLGREFIYSSSLDDRLCSFDALYGLIEFSQRFLTTDSLRDYDGFTGVYMSNHEEIGSGSRTGAKGGFLQDVLKSVVTSRPVEFPFDKLNQLYKNTILLSADVTHAFNPNYAHAYLKNNFPLPNVGPSIKFDSNGHVLSDSIGHVFLSTIIERHLPDLKLQKFHIRNDGRSGGTIGPIMSGPRGINGANLIIDVGLPILSMHSIRSTMGYKDVGIGVRFFREVFSHYQDTPSEIAYEY